MKLIAVQKDVLVNPEHIVSVEVSGKKLVVNMLGSLAYEVDVPTSELLSVLAKSGVDLNKQFLSV